MCEASSVIVQYHDDTLGGFPTLVMPSDAQCGGDPVLSQGIPLPVPACCVLQVAAALLGNN